MYACFTQQVITIAPGIKKKQKQNMSEEYFIHTYVGTVIHVWLFKHRV